MLNQCRVLIENIQPQVENGQFSVKKIVGEKVKISADILADGHDVLRAEIHYKQNAERTWKTAAMTPTTNDEWVGEFIVEKQGNYTYYIESWIDYALNWHYGISKKIADNQLVISELLEGATYLQTILKKASKTEKAYLEKRIELFEDKNCYVEAIQEAISTPLKNILTKYPEKYLANTSHKISVYVDRKKALFSTWYEFFPRSASGTSKHGTFKDCEKLLPRVAKMGFDTLYFPPIHPIGEVNRKGKNNATDAQKGDVGSPWGIGSKHGGHKSIHPELGTLNDFKKLVTKAKELNIEIAVDLAFQAAPDHPYIKENPQWFKWRPDGTAQYAENPPKKYQDILPIYYETTDWKNLWNELLSVALFWVEECEINIFRVDNPHTKPFYFWGWLIAEVKKKHPDVLFLAEAFTRPKIMHELGKQGFSQSYSYFNWRTSKHELIEYVTELTQTEQRNFFRPNFWPNTPDINPFHLQGANEAMHLIRYFLAATLSSSVGIYGPVFEQMISEGIPGKEEYQDSEKYQICEWNWQLENRLMTLIGKINNARFENISLQQTNNITFCDTDNDMLLAYYKFDDAKENQTLMVVNLDNHYAKQGFVKLPLQVLNSPAGQSVEVHDVITGASYIWDKEWNYVELHTVLPFHLFQIR